MIRLQGCLACTSGRTTLPPRETMDCCACGSVPGTLTDEKSSPPLVQQKQRTNQRQRIIGGEAGLHSICNFDFILAPFAHVLSFAVSRCKISKGCNVFWEFVHFLNIPIHHPGRSFDSGPGPQCPCIWCCFPSIIVPSAPWAGLPNGQLQIRKERANFRRR